MTDASKNATSLLQADVAIVGAGPCGLALAKGLTDLKYSVLVVEKEDGAKRTYDWSKAYTYRIDSRGAALIQRIGALENLNANSVAYTGFRRLHWFRNGSFSQKTKRVEGSLGYWLQRPHLIQLLKDTIPNDILVEAEVKEISFADESTKTATLRLDTGITIQAKYVFGCDGIKSIVRETLCKTDEAFNIHKVPSPSAGLVHRGTLIRPPLSLDPQENCTILGPGGDHTTVILSMLTVNGKAGELRPMGCARHAHDPMFQTKTTEEFYAYMETTFPQINARESIPIESAQAWIASEGATFPVPRWAGKALTLMKHGVLVGVLGDALHSFPPDLGLGVNSGLVDVNRLLDLMEQEQKEPSPEASLQSRVNALNTILVQEAEAICRLIPIGMPYQYPIPHTLHKVMFYGGFLTRFLVHKWFESLSKWTPAGLFINPLYPPVVVQIQESPPLRFTTILQRHHHNTAVLWSAAVVLGATTVGWVFQRNRGTKA